MLFFGQPCEILFSFYLFRAPPLEGQGILVFAWGRGSRCLRRNCRVRSKVEYMSAQEITGSCGCGVRIRPTILSSPLRFPSNLCRQLSSKDLFDFVVSSPTEATIPLYYYRSRNNRFLYGLTRRYHGGDIVDESWTCAEIVV